MHPDRDRPSPARQLARDVLPASVRRSVMATARRTTPPAPTASDRDRTVIAANLAAYLVHDDNGEPLRRPVRLELRHRIELEHARILLAGLLDDAAARLR